MQQSYDVGMPASLLPGQFVLYAGVTAGGKPALQTDPSSESLLVPIDRIRIVEAPSLSQQADPLAGVPIEAGMGEGR
jgi:hypothetical protein